ncbi:MAG: hypothetical protein M1831_006863 [Alyxoria varia]|nr:MAG: hypothetical protein M1831_006863 [Alyxoria varia]
MAEILSQSPANPTLSCPVEIPASSQPEGFHPNILSDPFDFEEDHSQDSTRLTPSTIRKMDTSVTPERKWNNDQDELPQQQSEGFKPKPTSLPAFSFNPGALGTETESESNHAPPSPTVENVIPSPKRGHHRRRTSEYIGSVSPVTVADPSPLQAEDSSTSQLPLAPPTMPGPARGHRHRRSAAMSSSDAFDAFRTSGGSSIPHLRNKASLSLPVDGSSTNAQGGSSDNSPKNAVFPSPTRVNFSENIEIIPEGANEHTGEPPKASSYPTKFGEDFPRKSAMAANPKYTGDTQVLISAQRPQSAGANAPSKPNLAFQERTTRDDLSLPVESDQGAKLIGGLGPKSIHADFSDFSRRAVIHSDKDEPAIGTDPEVSKLGQAPLTIPAAWADQAVNPPPPTLNVNFDDDPTSASVSELPRPKSLPTLRRRNKTTDSHDGDADQSAIDLDSAESERGSSTASQEELRSLRRKGFSAARQSMHSSGLGGSGFLAAGTSYHRRTESAPSLVTSVRDRIELLNLESASASDKGFEMSNVFEEEEDEPHSANLGDGKETRGTHGISKPSVGKLERPATEPTLLKGTRLQLDKAFESERKTSSHPPINTSDAEPADSSEFSDNANADTESSRSSDSTVKAGIDAKQIAQADSVSEHHDHSTETISGVIPPQHGSYINRRTDEPNRPAVPSIKTFNHSFTDSRRLSIPQIPTDRGSESRSSAEGVPSLVSSASTLASPAQKNTPDTSSPTYPLAPGSAGSSSTRSSNLGVHRKHSSVVSLSKLLRPSTPQRSNLSFEQRAQSPPFDGNGSHKEKKGSRLSRALHFWKPKPQD